MAHVLNNDLFGETMIYLVKQSKGLGHSGLALQFKKATLGNLSQLETL